jgi:hypothetical protein
MQSSLAQILSKFSSLIVAILHRQSTTEQLKVLKNFAVARNRPRNWYTVGQINAENVTSSVQGNDVIHCKQTMTGRCCFSLREHGVCFAKRTAGEQELIEGSRITDHQLCASMLRMKSKQLGSARGRSATLMIQHACSRKSQKLGPGVWRGFVIIQDGNIDTISRHNQRADVPEKQFIRPITCTKNTIRRQLQLEETQSSAHEVSRRVQYLTTVRSQADKQLKCRSRFLRRSLQEKNMRRTQQNNRNYRQIKRSSMNKSR